MILTIVVSLQFPAVQTFTSQKVAKFLSNELHADIHIGSVYFKPFSRLIIHDLEVNDSLGNTILFTKSLHSEINLSMLLNKENKSLSITSLKLSDAYFNLQTYKDSSNIKFLIDYFSSPNKKKKKKKKSINFGLGRIDIQNLHFIYKNNTKPMVSSGIDYNDIELTEFSGSFEEIKLDSLESSLKIEEMRFREKSGFQLKHLNAHMSVGRKMMEFKDLSLLTNRSNLGNYLKFEYQSFKDFEHFINRVKITGKIQNSYIDSKDIEFFAPEMEHVRFTTNIQNTNLSGTIANLQAQNISMSTESLTKVEGDLFITGLPDIDHTLFDLKSKRLVSDAQDIEKLVRQLSNQPNWKLPEQLHSLKTITFAGHYIGKYNDFEVNGLLNTELGDITTITKISIKDTVSYKGHASSNSFDLGKIISKDFLGRTGFDIEYDGKGFEFEKMQLKTKGNLQKIESNNFNLNQIDFEASIADQIILSSLKVQDSKVATDADLKINLKDESPQYDIKALVDSLSLSGLNLIKKSGISIHDTPIEASISGRTLNDLIGQIKSDEINLRKDEKTYTVKSLNLIASGLNGSRSLDLNSDVLNLKIEGEIDLNTIAPYFASVAMQYAPSIGLEKKHYNPQNFNLLVNIKDFEFLSVFVDHDIKLSKGAQIEAHFASTDNKADFALFSPEVQYRSMLFKNLSVIENASEQALSVDIMSERLQLSDDLILENLLINNKLSNDNLAFNISLAKDSTENHVRLNGNIVFQNEAPAKISFTKSEIVIRDLPWSIGKDGTVLISKGKVYVEGLRLIQDKQRIDINGMFSASPNDKVNIKFSRFDLRSIQGLTSPMGISLSGEMNGTIEVVSLFHSPYFIADISTTPIIYNDKPIGLLLFNAQYEPKSDIVDLNIKLLDEKKRGLILYGLIDVENQNNKLNLTASLNELDAELAQPFLATISQGISGKLSGDFGITGKLNHPIINGSALLKNTEFAVKYLNTKYIADNQRVLMNDNRIQFDKFEIRDLQNQIAVAEGTLDLNQITNPLIHINVIAQNFQILNTTFKNNSLYYGKAFTSGTFKFDGRTSNMQILIDATSSPNTKVYIPFDAAMTVSDSDFLYFVKDKTKKNKQNKQNDSFLEGLSMRMNLNINPSAEINLSTEIGALKSNGAGEVQLNISSLGDFEMYGSYSVRTGSFNFTAQDFINKHFYLKEGGTIRWSGNPTEGTINLTAIYQQRTAIGPLYNSAARPGEDERVLAQADMNITGTLSKPDIAFDLNFPLNPYIKDELQSYLSDANNVNQQALSLIVRRSFTATNSSDFGREMNSTLLSAGTEIAFGQLNNILTQSLNINFLDLNIRSLNDASASLRLFNDRLILTGGVTDQRNLRNTDLTFFSNKVVTDAELTYRIRRDGNLLFRAYNRVNTRNIFFTPTDDYINAVGLIYRQEFNSFGEYFKRLMTFRRKTETVQNDTSMLNISTK